MDETRRWWESQETDRLGTLYWQAWRANDRDRAWRAKQEAKRRGEPVVEDHCWPRSP